MEPIIKYFIKGMESICVVAPFDEAKEIIEGGGYEITSLEQMAKLRIQARKAFPISLHGNWTREGFIYVPKKGIFLTKNSPIMASAEKAIECHRGNKDFYLNSKQIEEALVDSCKIKGPTIEFQGVLIEIPSERLGEEEIGVYAFGKQAKAYGTFLKEGGVNTFKIRNTYLEEKSFATQAWLAHLSKGYNLHENFDDCDLTGGLRYSWGALPHPTRGVKECAGGLESKF